MSADEEWETYFDAETRAKIRSAGQATTQHLGDDVCRCACKCASLANWTQPRRWCGCCPRQPSCTTCQHDQ